MRPCRHLLHVLSLSASIWLLPVSARLRGRSNLPDPATDRDVATIVSNPPEREAAMDTPARASLSAGQIIPQALVIGGNGFIGSAMAERLLLDGYRVTLLNRNSSYFDIRERIGNRVGHIIWDRSKPMSECEQLEEYFVKHPVHAVIDLSCYDAQAARQMAIYISRFHVTWYIYVSTDSVYEVCDKKHPGLSREEDSVRPTDEELSKRLQAADSYGHQKLEAEEELMRIKERLEVDGPAWRYVFVRIPDVMGPRDTTYRWWLYQTLVKLQSELDVPVPLVEEDERGRKLSLVYVGDVAKAVAWLISSANTQIINMAINIAGYEQITFKTMIQDFADALGVNHTIKYGLNATTDLPSVKQGPVDLSLARRIGWQSTPWKEVVAEGVAWYETAMRSLCFSRERDAMLRMVYHQVAKYGKHQELRAALEHVYDLRATIVDRLLLDASLTSGEFGAGGTMESKAAEGLVVDDKRPRRLEEESNRAITSPNDTSHTQVEGMGSRTDPLTKGSAFGDPGLSPLVISDTELTKQFQTADAKVDDLLEKNRVSDNVKDANDTKLDHQLYAPVAKPVEVGNGTAALPGTPNSTASNQFAEEL